MLGHEFLLRVTIRNLREGHEVVTQNTRDTRLT
jgi:hypothetical protein